MAHITFPKKLFITGTDTDVGKTVISALLMAGMDAAYWKPVQAGLDEETDTEFVKRLSAKPDDVFIPERFRLETPMSPHGAADIDDVHISLSDFELPEFETEHLLVEGAGGLIVPLNWGDMVIDLIKEFEIPVLLVVRSSLGTLNHTLLSVEALRSRGIEIFALVMNGEYHASNKDTLEHFTKLPVFEVNALDELSTESLKKEFNKVFGNE